MEYWKEKYGKRSNEFIEGVIEGVETYAVWKNGRQVVGVMERPFREVIGEIKEQLGYKKEEK